MKIVLLILLICLLGYSATPGTETKTILCTEQPSPTVTNEQNPLSPLFLINF
jgi:hypothetical protein